jgi:Mg-chelatase subunit ChlD
MRPLRTRSSSRSRTAASTLLALAVLAAACGSRTGLLVPSTRSGQSSLFCAHADYLGGSGDITVLVLLDHSLSMADSGKWAAATAAIAAFVEDPSTAGLAIGLQYLPLGNDDCTVGDYAKPAVPVRLLPGNASAIEASLARTQPDGETPMVPALKGVMEYARALLIGDPTRTVAISLITDGQPEKCDPLIQDVAAVAASGASGNPPVLTFVTALEDDLFAQGLDTVAAAGGSGRAIRVSTPATAAQQLVDSFTTLRETGRQCRFAVPTAGDAQPTAADITVSLRATSTSPPRDASYVASASACSGGDAFWVDDPTKPAWVTLCPASCARVHAAPATHVEVTAGCGPGAPDGGPEDSGGDSGQCPGFDSLTCLLTCDPTSTPAQPICVGGDWVCPPGSIDVNRCTMCDPVPHGCCEPDGTVDDASCINAVWHCPPGATMFGQGSCQPPAVCAPLLPCAVGQYCTWPDDSCGSTRTAGTCKNVPPSCPGGGPSACGCDGATYGSVCAAAQGGIDVSTNQSCTAPSGTFPCGPLFCAQGAICEEVRDLSKSLTPQSWSCVAPPAGCTTGCGCNLCPPCPPGRMCKEVCSQVSGGGNVLSCNEL